MSDYDPRTCIIDTCQVQEREQEGYDVACVHDSSAHVCLFKPYAMLRRPRTS